MRIGHYKNKYCTKTKIHELDIDQGLKRQNQASQMRDSESESAYPLEESRMRRKL